jgi:uncharacterized protein (DUF433 family)
MCHMNTDAIAVDPEIMHGTPCFRGTRVPVRSLFDWLAHGHSLEYFLEQFPSVDPKTAEQVLEYAGDVVVERSLATAPAPA